jgi:DNA modification methylase
VNFAAGDHTLKVALGKVNRGDCVKGMAALEEGSVDLVFADPPFNIGYEYDAYNDRRDYDKYLDWSREWIKAVHRLLKKDGSFWLAIGDEYAAELKLIAQREAGFHCRSWVIWYYTFGVHCKKKFTRSHAHLFLFVKDPKKFTFNAAAVRVPSARQLVYKDKRANPTGRMPDDTWIVAPPVLDGFLLRPQDMPDGFRADEDTWYFARVCGTFKEREGWHGCQMPEQLLGRIIRVSSNEDDLVLDPFAGSGTTLVAAKKLGRRFVGFELSGQYAQQARVRIEAAHIGDKLTGPEEPLVSAPRTGTGRASRPVRRARKSRNADGNSLFPMDDDDAATG